MNDVKICYGCGVVLQTQFSSEVGYIPEEKLSTDPANIMCQRCFKLTHYGIMSDEDRGYMSSLQNLHQLVTENVLVLYVVDIFDYLGSDILNLAKFIGQNELILIANKVDILPRSIKESKLINWLYSQASKSNLHPLAVELVSAKTGKGIKELVAKIETLRNGRDVYVVGAANVGKSSFLNMLGKIGRNRLSKLPKLTTSIYAGTTLGPVKLPLTEKNFIVDTPGFINKKQIIHYMSKKSLSVLLPKKELKVRTYQLNSGQSLLFGGCVRLDFNKGARNSFSCYVSNDLDIHRTKLSKADSFYQKHVGGLLIPPNNKELATFPRLIPHKFLLKRKNMDIVFSGLGWVAVANAEAIITVHAPCGVEVITREAII